jgi:hypothetical protein
MLRPYDLYSVQLGDDSFGLGQLRAGDGCWLVLHRLRATTTAALAAAAHALTAADAIGALAIDARDLERAAWPLIGNRPVTLAELALPRTTRTFAVAVAADFLAAYHQLRAWDAPLGEIVLPGLAPPPAERAWLLVRLDAYARAPAHERQALREEVLRTRGYDRYARLALPDRAVAPLDFIERVLLTASLCDGYPDPRDHLLAIAYLTPFAAERQIDLQGPLDRIASLSSERVQLLLHGRLDQTRW